MHQKVDPYTKITQSWSVLQKKISMSFAKDAKANLIQGSLLQWGFVLGKRDRTQL